MKEDKFDTTNLKAGEQIPCVAQVENQNIYCFAIVCTVNETGFLLQTEDGEFPPMWLAYYHTGSLLSMQPTGKNTTTNQWKILEPTEENKTKVEQFKAFRQV